MTPSELNGNRQNVRYWGGGQGKTRPFWSRPELSNEGHQTAVCVFVSCIGDSPSGQGETCATLLQWI